MGWGWVNDRNALPEQFLIGAQCAPYWLRRSVHGVPDYPSEVRRNLLGRLTAAEGLEHYLHTKYVG